MRLAGSPGGRVGFGAAALISSAVMACAPDAPTTSFFGPSPSPSPGVTASVTPSSGTPAPSSPSAFAIESIDRAFPVVTALASTGEQLYWASGASIWRFMPGDPDAVRVYESSDNDAAIWDLAATDGGLVFSERLGTPDGGWHVSYLTADGAQPVEIDRGIAGRGAPPTLAIDGPRIAWAGFDESSGAPRSFMRVVERAGIATPITLRDVEIDAGLLWYPQLDGETLWYSIIEPDFGGAGGGDEFHIETIDLANPSVEPVPFQSADRDFEPAVSGDYVVWKSVAPQLSALTWGELHVLDRRSNERLVIADQANHPSIGSRFVAFEEISHNELLLYDLATRSLVDIPEPTQGAKGTIGVPAISGNLLAYSVSVRGSNTVRWVTLPH